MAERPVVRSVAAGGAGGAGGDAASATPELLAGAMAVASGEDATDVIATSPQRLATEARDLVAAGARHVMLVAIDRTSPDAPEEGDRLAVEEVLALPDGRLARLAAPLAAGRPRYPSITPFVPAASWDEREAFDLFGIEPVGHPDPRPLVLHDLEASPPQPLRRRRDPAPPRRPAFAPFVAQGDGVYELPVGPIHAGIIEPGHFRFSAVGESILFLDARLFYTHRGLERLVEGRPFGAALPVVERACGVCSVTHGLAFCRAVEALAGADVPPRARFGRVLLAELERLYNHVGDLGNICAGVGFHYGTSQLGWLKERLLRVNEGLTGHRYLTGSLAPGGLRMDLRADVLAAVPTEVDAIVHEVRSVVRSLLRSESLMTRLHGAGVARRELALSLGAVGVAARAAGLTQDLRRDRPYEAYAELDVPLVTAAAGDVAARFHVRAQEIVASAALVRQSVARIPDGPHRIALARLPDAGASVVTGVEGPRGASWLWLMVDADGRVDRLHLRSASFANWPLVAAAVPGNLVPDFPLINKSFELCYACTDR